MLEMTPESKGARPKRGRLTYCMTHSWTELSMHACSHTCVHAPFPQPASRFNDSITFTQTPRFLVPTEAYEAIPFCLRDPGCYLPNVSLRSSHLPATGARRLWNPFSDPGAHHGQGHRLAIRKAIEGLADGAIPACSTAANLEGWVGSVRG